MYIYRLIAQIFEGSQTLTDLNFSSQKNFMA